MPSLVQHRRAEQRHLYVNVASAASEVAGALDNTRIAAPRASAIVAMAAHESTSAVGACTARLHQLLAHSGIADDEQGLLCAMCSDPPPSFYCSREVLLASEEFGMGHSRPQALALCQFKPRLR